MKTTIIALTIDPRTDRAPEVQTVLTKHGCIIKTRVGLHEVQENSCSERGLILLHINSDSDEVQQLENELKDIEGIKIKCMTL
ncbi:hypothetical protein [Clostridium vincentii]|uniref:Iron-only hydrogenase system regulator n=1 Tax=Clostridium vincentii TaxID=52704 RepID=A0A2T0B9J1_9CLOT|nr:hypothetical protein [Clostridium vincentii]PRR80467.1 hypothetical protein CLVI_30430 [Clostridium vincentii]